MGVTISTNYNKGYAKATKFSFSLDSDTLSNYSTYLWDFGDGEYSREPNPTHIYKNPSDYTVTVNVYDSVGNNDSAKTDILVTLYLNESIYFDLIPPPTFASHLNRYPFKVNITSFSTDNHTIDLGCQFSKSYQYQEPENKWSFLRPQWRFLDLNGNQIDQIQTIDTPILIDDTGNISPSGTVVGVSGTAYFYFVDDLYNLDLYIQNKPYSTMILTLQTSGLKSLNDSYNLDDKTPSYSNSLASVTLPHIFTWREPDFVKIKENGITNFSSIRFVNQNNPILVNFGVDQIYNQDDLPDGNGVKISNEYEFIHYVPFNDSSYYKLLSSYNIPITINGYDVNNNPLDFVFTPPDKEFKFKDSNGFKTGGYYKGSFTNSTSSLNCGISAKGVFPLPDLSSKFINPILWISNPNAGMFATAQYFYTSAVSDVTLNYLDKSHVNAFNMPIVKDVGDGTFFSNGVYAVSGIHGINNIAALPPPTYHAWVTDTELNKLYRINSVGDILIDVDINAVLTELSYTSLQLSFLIPNQTSPQGLAIDSKQNVWVALYDTPYIFKFDNEGKFLLNTDFSKIENIQNPSFLQWWQDQSDILALSGSIHNSTIDDSYPIQPTFLETDLNDNVWVTYSSPFSSWLVQYTSAGNLNFTYQYPLCTSPQELVCDNQNSIWIICANDVANDSGFIEKRDSMGNVLNSYGPFNGINHLTLDTNQTPWFTYHYNWIANIDQTGNITKIPIHSGSYSDDVPNWFDANYNTDETALEGITCDLLGRIYVINSIENKVYVLDSNTKQIIDSFYINPKGFVYALSGQNSPTSLFYDPWSKSAQAIGDWSGFRWANKYFNLSYQNGSYINDNGTLYKNISGSIEPNKVSFYPFNYYDFFKVNENFDLAGQMKNNTFQTTLLESTNLYNFLSSIFGVKPLKHEDLGVSSYEKIANYISNISDIDTCSIESLYDLSQSVDLNFDDYQLNYPLAMKRIMDMVSIHENRLFGSELADFYNFNTSSQYSNFNRGALLDSFSYNVTAGVPVILKKRSLNKYQYIPTGPFFALNSESVLNITTEGLSTYPLSDLAYTLDLGDNWQHYYEFYEYIPSANKIYSDNIIDWNNSNIDRDSYITFLKNVSSDSYLPWNSDQGMIDYLFTQQLYKGLGLI